MKRNIFINIINIMFILLVDRICVTLVSKWIIFYSYKEYVIYEFVLAILATIFLFFGGNIKVTLRFKRLRERTYIGVILTIFYFVIIGALVGVSFMSQIMKGNNFLLNRNTFFFLVFCFLIGYTEEILYRGLFLGNLLKCRNTKRWKRGTAVGISLLFALMHYQTFWGSHNIMIYLGQIIVTFICGLIFTCMYVETGNIWISIVAHALYDFRVGMDKGVFGYKGSLKNIPLLEVKTILFVIFLVGSLILSIRFIRRIEVDNNEIVALREKV